MSKNMSSRINKAFVICTVGKIDGKIDGGMKAN